MRCWDKLKFYNKELYLHSSTRRFFRLVLMDVSNEQKPIGVSIDHIQGRAEHTQTDFQCLIVLTPVFVFSVTDCAQWTSLDYQGKATYLGLPGNKL